MYTNEELFYNISNEFKQIIEKMENRFGFAAQLKDGRATHTSGVIAKGEARIIVGPNFPEHAFLSPGQTYKVILRHANIKGMPDDAGWDGRGAALKFLEQDSKEEINDILLNTGRVFFAANAHSFQKFALADLEGRKELIKKGIIVGSAIQEAFRNPSSYTELYYHSQIAYKLIPTTGEEKYLRYRLINADRAPERGFLPKSFLVGARDFIPRQKNERRMANYLREDFTSKVNQSGVNYLLQVQLAPINKHFLDCTVPWDEKSFPWIDVASINLNEMANELGEELRFAPDNTPKSISLPLTTSAKHPASIGHLRAIVYRFAAKVRDEESEYVYEGPPGVNLPRFAPNKPLPPAERPSRHYLLQSALTRPIPTYLPPQGIVGVFEEMGKDFFEFMPANLTRLEPNSKSDEFFIERRINGFHPGQIRAEKRKKPWDYIIKHDISAYKQHPAADTPKVVECRFTLKKQQLKLHSIKYDNKKVLATDKKSEWQKAKQYFLDIEFFTQELGLHLGKCHLNMEQYAMAFKRNISPKNPLWSLLSKHFEGLININWRGARNIIGPTGFITLASTIEPNDIMQVLKDEISLQDYHISPTDEILPIGKIRNDHFSPAVCAMWELLSEYVKDFMKKWKTGLKKNWPEIKGMSNDLTKHSILKNGTLAIECMDDLQQLCTYVIYHSIFLHPWSNFKQYDDAGDITHVRFGRWNHDHPKYDADLDKGTLATQINLTRFLSSVHYKPIMIYGEKSLKEHILARRKDIEPGLPIKDILMSINI